MGRFVPILFLLALATAPSTNALSQEADYTTAVDQELARLNIEASCDPASRICTVKDERSPPEQTLEATVVVNPKTATVYAYIDPFIELANPDGPDLALAKRMLSLNKDMITCKLEWNQAASSIRLSTVLSTDSNFDRKAFRSQLLGLFSTARALSKILFDGPSSNTKEGLTE